MKKIFPVMLAILFIISGSAFAANNLLRSVGVVVIGGAEFKTPEFYKIIKKEFDPKSGAKFVVSGDLQNKYQKFLINRNLVGNNIPRREDLIDFTAASGYGKILFIVIPNSTADHQNNSYSRQKDRISVQVDGYLCNNLSVVEVATSSQHSNSKTSDLRARRGAFRKCLEDLSKTLNRAM